MNLRVLAVVACILAFLSLPFEWWTLYRPTSFGVIVTGEMINVYLYRTVMLGNLSTEVNSITLEGWETIILMLVGAVLGGLSAIKVKEEWLWLGSGICIAAGVTLFSARWLNFAILVDLTAYPNVGTLIAILSAILMFIGFLVLRRERIRQKEMGLAQNHSNEAISEEQAR